jgi:hypothetical protein
MKNTKLERAILEAQHRPVVKLDSVRPGVDDAGRDAVSVPLSEDRFTHPPSTAAPAVAQRGLIGEMLERERTSYEAMMRRNAIRLRTLEVAADVLMWLRSAFTPSASETIGEPVRVHVPNATPDRS